MPELPEVETVRRRLEPVVVGQRFAHVQIDDARLTRPFDLKVVEAELTGERVAALDRRGKYLIFRFESGRGLLVHLRMTGSFRHAPAEGLPDDPHRRAVVRLEDGSDVAYRDVRRFGTWLLLEPEELDEYLAARVGREPLAAGFTAKRLSERLAGRRAPIKAALLDQRTLAGMGNIYADEALWRARIHPLWPARELDDNEVRRLHRAVRAALDAGLARQGATLRDYATPDGESGEMQHEFKVYGREGEPCDRCGTPIEKTRAGGRGTWYCPRCQPARPQASPEAGAQAASRSSSAPARSRRQSSV
ncbi:MAG TPA: bifunctional DNA-formamidopyrimidine glycosylase/DNA-(apurinic or apyrimidinic site) lyase [Gaiellaceae bacterium]